MTFWEFANEHPWAAVASVLFVCMAASDVARAWAIGKAIDKVNK